MVSIESSFYSIICLLAVLCCFNSFCRFSISYSSCSLSFKDYYIVLSSFLVRIWYSCLCVASFRFISLIMLCICICKSFFSCVNALSLSFNAWLSWVNYCMYWPYLDSVLVNWLSNNCMECFNYDISFTWSCNCWSLWLIEESDLSNSFCFNSITSKCFMFKFTIYPFMSSLSWVSY